MKADLHVHSTASDGTLSPSQVVALALERGLSVLAIADHDSVDGLLEALEAAAGSGLTLVPAVELSAVAGSLDVHILGYFIDHQDPTLHVRLADLREARFRRARTMVAMLADAGYAVDFEDVVSLTDGGAIGRSHIARALVDCGHAQSVRDAFERFIGRGRPYYVAKDVRSPAEAIATIRRAGGVAVVAHPGVSGLDPIMRELVDAGLGGIEAHHADHTPEQRERYAMLAAELGLLVTGGTDFHGHGAPNPELGLVDLPEEAVQGLLAWGRAHAEFGRG